MTQPTQTPAAAALDDAEQFAVAAARVAHDFRCSDVAVYDVRGISGVADFFVIATGSSDRQMHAALEAIAKFAKSAGRKAFRVADPSDAAWILADYVDVMVHLFDANHREYYDLDGLWGDAPRVEWSGSKTETA